jgi:hypothetical protein
MAELTVKGLSRSLIASLQNGGKYPFCSYDDIEALKKWTKSTMTRILKNAQMNLKELQELIEENTPVCFSNLIKWNVFGDATSTDIDLIVYIDSKNPMKSIEYERLCNELVEIGYEYYRMSSNT